jgi:hypothetical protein
MVSWRIARKSRIGITPGRRSRVATLTSLIAIASVLRASDGTGTTYPVTFSGAAGAMVPQGSAEFPCDPIVGLVTNGPVTLRIRAMYTLPAAGYVYGQNYGTSRLEAGSPDVCYNYDPANRIDDVYGTSAIATPTGSVAGHPITPALVVANVASTKKAYVSGVSSIEYGLKDFATSNPLLGGGPYRRAFSGLLGRPHISIAQNGQKWSDLAGAKGTAIFQTVCKYSTDFFCAGDTNGVIQAQTAASIRTRMQGYYTMFRGFGIKRIVQTDILCRTAAIKDDRCTTKANQQLTPVGFGVGGVADQVNAAILADVGRGFFDAYVGLRALICDPTDHHYWRTDDLLTQTLGAAYTAATQTIGVASDPRVGAPLIFDPGGPNQAPSGGNAWMPYLDTGSGPFKLTAFTAIGVNGADSGTTLKVTRSADYVHPWGFYNQVDAQSLV